MPAAAQPDDVLARATLAADTLTQVPYVAAWRDAYRAFGAKPQRTRNSLEALLRRAPGGLPRVNRLTDLLAQLGPEVRTTHRVIDGRGADTQTSTC